MTDLFLMGIFVLCIVIGYFVVKRSGGILEHMLFRNSNSWYNLRESNEPCRDAGAGNACSQAISRDSGSIGRMPASPEKQSFFGLGTAQKREQTETGADAGVSSREDAASRRKIGRTPASPEKQSFFGPGTARLKNYKAGIRHEWKTN